MSNPRRANGHRRNQILRQVKAEESICWLCGGEVDTTLPPGLPESPEVDEVVPVAEGGDPLDRANCRLSHRACNHLRGQQTKAAKRARRALAPLVTSRSW